MEGGAEMQAAVMRALAINLILLMLWHLRRASRWKLINFQMLQLRLIGR